MKKIINIMTLTERMNGISLLLLLCINFLE